MDEVSKEIVGNTKVLLDQSKCRARECNIGNLVTDAMVYSYAINYTGRYWTDAGIAFMQSGGIRASTQIGNISRADLMTVFPFNNALVIVNATGKDILKALEHSVHRHNGDYGEFLQMSGIQVVFDLSKPPHQRVVSVRAICTECDVPQFLPLDENKNYPIIMTTFMQEGGDEFEMFKVTICFVFDSI